VVYAPFGEPVADEGTDHSGRRIYAGHERQEATGLVYMNARWYLPASGRFFGVDAVVRSPRDPQSLNGYSYVENNPVAAIDPTGMASEHDEFDEWGSSLTHLGLTATGSKMTDEGIVWSEIDGVAKARAEGDEVLDDSPEPVSAGAGVSGGAMLGPYPIGVFGSTAINDRGKVSTEAGAGIAAGGFLGGTASGSVSVEAGAEPETELAFIALAGVPGTPIGVGVDARVAMDSIGASAEVSLVRGSGAFGFIGIVGQGPSTTLGDIEDFFGDATTALGQFLPPCSMTCGDIP